MGFLREQLEAERQAVQYGRTQEQRLYTRLRAATEESMQARLEVDHVKNQGVAHRRTAEGLRQQLEGAQVWAREAEANFEEMLAQAPCRPPQSPPPPPPHHPPPHPPP